MMKSASRYFLSSIVFALAVSTSALAYSSRGYESMSGSSSAGVGVPVSGSIAMPGSTTATYTNPAGLVGSPGARLSLQGGSDKPMDDPTYRALVLAGNGTFGASAGVKYHMYDGSRDDEGYAVYGLAVNVAPLDFTMGVAGHTGIKSAQGSDFNAGILFRPTSMVAVGATAMGIKDQVDSYGVGVGLNLVSGVDLVADSAFDGKFKNGEFKPGLRLANDFAGLSVSYGTGSTAQFAKDFSAAAYLKVGANSEFEFEYNHGGDLPKYFASLLFGF
ncbi:MAG: hypothetical protein JST04_11720 [Bdellovibrionales bacterium]|nr:hypothetical protein [Bdellovibrionales bacterium]